MFARVSWDEALDLIAERMIDDRDRFGAEAILPFCYGGSNGLLTQDTNDATLWRAFGTSRLARTVCAAPTGAANIGLYGKMPGVAYEDYVHARLIVLWGVNPSASGIHLVPFIKEAREAGAKLVVIDPRATPLASRPTCTWRSQPGTDSAGRAGAAQVPVRSAGTPTSRSSREHARGVDELRARADRGRSTRAAQRLPASTPTRSRALRASCTRRTTPAVIRCGWGLERNRNGGSAVAAVLALPAVAGKFGVRGGGFTMSNSTAFGIKAATWMNDTPEPSTRIVNMNKLGDALARLQGSAGQVLFVYNCNPLATMPNQNRVLEGLKREDLFTVVFEQVLTDTARYADVVLPATTFLEHYDIAKGYGPISLQLVRPVIEPVGEARPNPEVFSELAARLGIGEAEEETGTLLRIAGRLPNGDRRELLERGAATPPFGGRPIQFVDVFPLTPDGRSISFRRRSTRGAGGPLRLPAGSGDRRVSAGADLAREREDHLVDARRAARAPGHAADASVGRRRARPRAPTIPCASSTISARCTARSRVTPNIRPGTVSLRRACGARAPTTARRRTRWSPIR